MACCIARWTGDPIINGSKWQITAQYSKDSSTRPSFGIILATVITLFLILALYLLRGDFGPLITDTKNLLLGRDPAPESGVPESH